MKKMIALLLMSCVMMWGASAQAVLLWTDLGGSAPTDLGEWADGADVFIGKDAVDGVSLGTLPLDGGGGTIAYQIHFNGRDSGGTGEIGDGVAVTVAAGNTMDIALVGQFASGPPSIDFCKISSGLAGPTGDLLNVGGDCGNQSLLGLAAGDYRVQFIEKYDGEYADLTFTVTGGAPAPPVNPVPEPAGLGLVGLALLAVRKRRS